MCIRDRPSIYILLAKDHSRDRAAESAERKDEVNLLKPAQA